MIISLIVALAQNNAIGKDNTLPWHLPEDLKFFKRTTLGKPIIMGRKTYESLGRPLPGRLNIVLSSSAATPVAQGVVVCQTIEQALAQARQAQAAEVCIIGGGQIYAHALPLADRLYITRVDTTVADADTFFPTVDHTHFKRTWHQQHPADDKHPFSFTFEQYERIAL